MNRLMEGSDTVRQAEPAARTMGRSPSGHKGWHRQVTVDSGLVHRRVGTRDHRMFPILG